MKFKKILELMYWKQDYCLVDYRQEKYLGDFTKNSNESIYAEWYVVGFKSLSNDKIAFCIQKYNN